MDYYSYDKTPNALVGIQRHKVLLRQCGLPIAVMQKAVQFGDLDNADYINDKMADLRRKKQRQVERLLALIDQLDDEIRFLEHVPGLIDWNNEQRQEVA